MSFCLIKPLAQEFQQRLKSGEINPEKLTNMTSAERHGYFESFLGAENAKEVNALFESKLLLTNQKAGMISWATSVAGMKAEVRRDLVSKINKLDRVLNPVEETAFLNDLASKKLGTDVSLEEAKQIAELAKQAEEAKQTDLTDFDNRVAYGNKILDLHDYADKLKQTTPSLAERAVNVANLPKSIMSSMDFSAPFRQGWGMMSRGEFWKAMPQMFKFAASEKAYRDMQADIITRPSYDKMKAAGLRITKISEKLSDREEAFQSSILDKIPGFRGSERAYAGFLNKVRADVFDNLLQSAELAGEDVAKGSKVNRELAQVVNDFTGSGDVGKNDRYKGAVPLLNTMFFSPRKIAATVNMLNPVRYADPRLSPTARKAALRNIIGSVGMSATVLAIAQAFGAKSEKDPRSSDFGKIVIGKNHYDVTGGNATYVTLLARLMSNQTKSTTTDIVSTMGQGFGSSNRGDVAIKYFRNKLSPTASFAVDWLYGENAVGDPFDMTDEVKSRVMPLGMSDFIENMENDSGSAFPNALLSMFGVGVQNYSSGTDWSKKPGAELQQFRENIGDKDFEKANEEYNTRVEEKIKEFQKAPEYQALPDDEKSPFLTRAKDQIKQDIFKKYGFKYKQAKKVKDAELEKLLK